MEIAEEKTHNDGQGSTNDFVAYVDMSDLRSMRLELAGGIVLGRTGDDAWATEKGVYDERPQTPYMSKGTINQNTGKEVLAEMLANGKNASEIVQAKGLEQVSDTQQILTLIEKVLESHPDEVQSYMDGKETVINWLFGQVMRQTKGKANPQIVKKLLYESLKK